MKQTESRPIFTVEYQEFLNWMEFQMFDLFEVKHYIWKDLNLQEVASIMYTRYYNERI